MAQKKGKSVPRWQQRLHHWWQRRWVRIIAYIAATIAGFLLVIGFLNTFIFTPLKNPEYGVSFSVKQARNLGVDWKANFTAVVDDLQFKRLRLMSYWDESEAKRGQLNFADLDWQMDEAAKRGVKVSLGLGLRQPRWPECHEPAWATELRGHEWKQALYAYMEIVVNRYKDHPALESYQLENEGMNNWFGLCDLPDRERLIEEFTLVKKWDSNTKVIMSLSDQHGFPINGPTPDEFGFSVYRVVWNDKIPPHGYITYPTPIWYHRMRAAIITAYTGKPIMIHELQMEPWGPVDTKYLTIEEQNKSMSTQQIAKSFKFARQLGINHIYTWGSEWWYWRKVHGDDTVWEAIRAQLRNP
jgi:hypothetical protein